MTTRRRGTLTDYETMMLYENGESLIALAVHEGLSPSGVWIRVQRARKKRGYTIRRRAPLTITDSLLAVAAACDRLDAAVQRLQRRSRRSRAAA